MNRRELIEKRLEQILSQWLQADRAKRDQLLVERIRLQHELEDLEQDTESTARR